MKKCKSCGTKKGKKEYVDFGGYLMCRECGQIFFKFFKLKEAI